MRTYLIALIFAAGTALGVGCTASKSPADSVAALGALEARVTKLEKDLRAAEATRDAAVGRASAAELAQRDLAAKLAALTASHQVATRDRDGLKVQLAARTAEKDQLAQHLDQFRKNLRELLGQVDSAAGVDPAARTVSATR